MINICKSLLLSFLYIAVITSLCMAQQIRTGYSSVQFDTIISYTDTTEEYLMQNLSYSLGNTPLHSGSLLTKDGHTLYYFTDILTDSSNAHNQEIHYIIRENESWSLPKELSELNNAMHNGIHFVSHDKKRLLVLGEYLSKNISREGLSMTCYDAKNDKWHLPVPLKIKKYYNNSLSSYFMNKEEDVLLLAIDGTSSFGQQDIYVSFKIKGNKWSKPMNVGGNINTPMAEGTIHLSDDEKTMYFSSNGFSNSFGGFDIYKTERLDDSWTSWSDPVNIGAPFNSKNDDLYYTSDVKNIQSIVSRAYSTEMGVKQSDLILYTKRDVQQDTCIELYVNVFDKKSLEKVAAEVKIKHNEQSLYSFSNGLNPEAIKLLGNEEYTLEVNNKNYLSHETTFIDKCTSDKTRAVDIYLQPKQVNTAWELENVFFKFDSNILLEASIPALENIKNILVKEHDLVVEISGHTDTRGDNNYNMLLSQSRANAIVEYLIEHGIEKDRLKAKGYGETQVKNHCANGVYCDENKHQENRRVEIKILEIKTPTPVNF